MIIQVTYAQFLSLLSAIGPQAIVLYAVIDGLVALVAIKDPKFGGMSIQPIEDFPTEAAFLLVAPNSIRVSGIF